MKIRYVTLLAAIAGLMAACGNDRKAGMQPDPSLKEAASGKFLSSSLIPAMIFGMGVATLCFYPITKKYNEQMQAELADRRSKAGY